MRKTLAATIAALMLASGISVGAAQAANACTPGEPGCNAPAPPPDPACVADPYGADSNGEPCDAPICAKPNGEPCDTTCRVASASRLAVKVAEQQSKIERQAKVIKRLRARLR